VLRDVLALLAGTSAAEPSRKHAVSQTTIGKWKDKFLAGAQTGWTSSQPGIDPRDAEIEQLKLAWANAVMVNEALKKALRSGKWLSLNLKPYGPAWTWVWTASARKYNYPKARITRRNFETGWKDKQRFRCWSKHTSNINASCTRHLGTDRFINSWKTRRWTQRDPVLKLIISQMSVYRVMKHLGLLQAAVKAKRKPKPMPEPDLDPSQVGLMIGLDFTHWAK
jgi:transposase-like protein